MILTISVVSVFAVEKSKTFGDFTVYFDTEDVDKCYINPQETALRQNLKIFSKMPAYKIKKYKGSVIGYSILKKEAENGKGNKYRDYLLCTALIIRNNLAGGVFVIDHLKANLIGHIYLRTQKVIYTMRVNI